MSVLDPQTRREASVLTSGLGVAVACALLMTWLSRHVLAGDLSMFDEAVRAHVHGQWPWILPVMLLCTFVGGPSFLGVASIILFVVMWRHRMRHEDGLLVSAMAGAIVLGMVLKETYLRPRPTPFYGLPTPSTWSYPSGHALGSFCFFVALALLLSPSLQGRQLVAVWLACVTMVLLVGFSRIYLGVHWPSDVLGGWLTGAIWMSVVAVAFRPARPRPVFARPEEPGT